MSYCRDRPSKFYSQCCAALSHPFPHLRTHRRYSRYRYRCRYKDTKTCTICRCGYQIKPRRQVFSFTEC